MSSFTSVDANPLTLTKVDVYVNGATTTDNTSGGIGQTVRSLLASGRRETAERLADGWNRADGLFGALDARRLSR